jgi:ribonuclease HII
MHGLEGEARRQGYQFIAGIDEAGRGPLAGPVVAAAVIFPPDVDIPGVNDSKKLSPTARQRLFPKICRQALAFHIAVVDRETIDRINILQASLLAMQQAVEGLATRPDFLLVDGNRGIVSAIPQKAVIGGDALCFAIAAASILAKVERDRLMQEFHSMYPQYEFARHKGYGTQLHRDRIKEFGPCPIHRRTFAGVKEHLSRLPDAGAGRTGATRNLEHPPI